MTPFKPTDTNLEFAKNTLFKTDPWLQKDNRKELVTRPGGHLQHCQNHGWRVQPPPDWTWHRRVWANQSPHPLHCLQKVPTNVAVWGHHQNHLVHPQCRADRQFLVLHREGFRTEPSPRPPVWAMVLARPTVSSVLLLQVWPQTLIFLCFPKKLED